MIVSILIASILAVVFIAFRVTFAEKNVYNAVIGTFIKALASAAFIAVGVTAVVMGGIDGTGISIQAAIFIVGGQILGLIGDIVLDLKVAYAGRKEEDVYLTGGMVSFGLGHILFFIAILLYTNKFGSFLNGSVIGICIAVAAVLAFAMVFGGDRLMKFQFKKFTIHSILYAFLLLFMAAVGIAAWVLIGDKNSHMGVFGIGMVLFLLSDIVLTKMYFGGKPDDRGLCIVNHALYYAAQICLASFIFYMA